MLHGDAIFACHEVDEQNVHSHVLAFEYHDNLSHAFVLLWYLGNLSDGTLTKSEFSFEHEIIFVEMEQLEHATVRVGRLLRQMNVYVECKEEYESVLALKLLDEAVFDHELLGQLEFELVCVQLVVRWLEGFLMAEFVNLITVLVPLDDVELAEVEAVEGLLQLVLGRLLRHLGRVRGQIHAMKLVNVRVIVLGLVLRVEAPASVELKRGRLLLVGGGVLGHLALLVDADEGVGTEGLDAYHAAERVGGLEPLLASTES